MSEAVQQAAIVAALTEAGAPAFDQSDLKRRAKLPTRYVEVWVMERPSEEQRGGGVRSGARLYRVLTRVVAEDYGDAQEVRRRVSLALEDAALTIAGAETTPIRRAVADDPIADDDHWWSGVSEWSYAH